MNGNLDTAGIFFSALMIVGILPFGLYAFRRRGRVGDDDPTTRFAARTVVGATIANGIVNVIRAMGRMPDDTTYIPLNAATMLLLFSMVFIYLLRQHRANKRLSAGTDLSSPTENRS